jgi:hypothetical protein
VLRISQQQLGHLEHELNPGSAPFLRFRIGFEVLLGKRIRTAKGNNQLPEEIVKRWDSLL